MSEMVRAKPALFSEGYFSRRIEAGERPIYGRPKSRLPPTDGEPMALVTSFMGALADDQR